MTDEVVFFRLGLFLILVFALLDESADAYIGFWWFFFRLGLLYHLLFRIDVGLFFPGWASSVTFFFFFLCLKVEQIILFIYLRVFLIFFKG